MAQHSPEPRLCRTGIHIPGFSPSIIRVIWSSYHPEEASEILYRQALIEVAFENSESVYQSIDYLIQEESIHYKDNEEQLDYIRANHPQLRAKFRAMDKQAIEEYIGADRYVPKSQKDTSDKLFCPICNSTEIYSKTNGFSGPAAIGGAIIAGPIGAAAGFIGMNKLLFKCNCCGHTWYPKASYLHWEEYR